MKYVTPKTFFLGATEVDEDGLRAYLDHTDQLDFWWSYQAARDDGMPTGLALCSFFAKLCYSALTPDKNLNITRVRDIPDNIRGTLNSAHGSVFEHCNLNFVTTDCSRVFTHELVRHRAGTAFSQTSGRYVRSDELRVVMDPLIAENPDTSIEMEAALTDLWNSYQRVVGRSGVDKMTDFGKKKKITSALRRLLPNGQANEIGWSVNLRTLRHTIMIRTSRHAEWEIRHIFNDVYNLVKDRFPLMFEGAREEAVDGLIEVSGLKLQPYEVDPGEAREKDEALTRAANLLRTLRDGDARDGLWGEWPDAEEIINKYAS